MQPLFSLNSSSFNPADSALSASLLPEAATEPVAVFADTLRVETADNAAFALIPFTGSALPATGKLLPSAATTPVLAPLAVGTDVSAIDRVPDAPAPGLQPGIEVDLELELELEPPLLPAGLAFGRQVSEPTAAADSVIRDDDDASADGALAAIVNPSAVPLLPTDPKLTPVVTPPQASNVVGVLTKPVLQPRSTPTDAIRPAVGATIEGAPPTAAERLVPIGPALPLNVLEPAAATDRLPDGDVALRADALIADLARAETAATSRASATPAFNPPVASIAGQGPLAAAGGDAMPAGLSDRIDVPVRDAAFGERLGERVVLMANGRLQHANLQLSPAELGPLRIQLSVDNDVANVSFVATHSSTREAIEAAIPRLRTMFEEQGLTLGQTSVGGRGADQGDGELPRERAAEGERGSEDAVTGLPAGGPAERRIVRGLLDTFV